MYQLLLTIIFTYISSFGGTVDYYECYEIDSLPVCYVELTSDYHNADSLTINTNYDYSTIIIFDAEEHDPDSIFPYRPYAQFDLWNSGDNWYIGEMLEY